ncbi:MAG: mandelate racemase/muconate lactonizing enzyme family protein, partial [bacterium]
MKIKKVEARRYSSDKEDSYVAEIVVVEVFTDSDVSGLGFVSAPPGVGAIFHSLIENVLALKIVGIDPRLTSELWERMYNDAIPRRGGEGIVRMCIAAIDIAIWDIKGKVSGVPVSKLLGSHRELIPTYANCAHHMPPEELAERAASYVAKGHKALKIRGTRSFVTLDEATERVRQVRSAIGPDVRLMVDVNGSWDVDTAIQQLKEWDAYDVYWLEEPVAPDDIPGYALVRNRAGSTYIAGGEQHAGLLEFRTLIQQGQVDVVQPNALITGGITDWLRIHAFATANGIPISPWNLQTVHVHLAAGLPNVKWIEYFMPDNALLEFQTKLFRGPVIDEVVTNEGVFLRAPQDPGIGLK